ncbi:hypothetical protein G3N56_01990 [Desulfovibrio sulfodismutans]|uniref:Uncharacterized protein n=1 Tax=Desulfolutivibrio sulfodismutans TaxID=63561 RepID=A0A7K3NH47_9BACT|nr:hypothetical protein [Desulfolutivibrio sulfodismutans]NDY55516.1 hypothetical protein [Desulfolutivibrio sulfodismutans]QLA12904.1 hypothetical protein GD606_11780 [Desulfolutivibrio sulfodismutans DSM 3696]
MNNTPSAARSSTSTFVDPHAPESTEMTHVMWTSMWTRGCPAMRKLYGVEREAEKQKLAAEFRPGAICRQNS